MSHPNKIRSLWRNLLIIREGFGNTYTASIGLFDVLSMQQKAVDIQTDFYREVKEWCCCLSFVVLVKFQEIPEVLP